MTQTRSTAQWLGLTLIVAIISVLCGIAAQWQWHRHEARALRAAQVNELYDAPAQPLVAGVVPSASGTQAIVPAEREWMKVRLRGHYVPQYTAILRNRPVHSAHVFHILVPFEIRGGTLVLVNRGTLPMGSDTDQPNHIPEVPSGELEIEVNLRRNEPASGRGAPPGQVQAINISEVMAAVDGQAWSRGRIIDGYGILRTESTPAAQSPDLLPRPDLSLGNHLSYTWQWVMFGVGIWVALIALWVRERRESAAEAAELLSGPDAAGTPPGTSPTARKSSPAPKRRSAEEEEDALIDSQL